MLDAFSPQQINLTLGQVALNLSLSFALAYLAAWVYRRVHSGPSYSFSFYVTLLVTPVVVTMIMMAIGSNVAMSLGLVGALSIIRFRTVVKDPRDMSYLFLMIGIGLCCGSGAYALAILGTLFVCTMLVVVHKIARGGAGPSEFILIFRKQNGHEAESEAIMGGLLSWRKLHGVTDLGESEGCEYTYRIRLSGSAKPETLIDRLRNVGGLSHATLISPDSQVDI